MNWLIKNIRNPYYTRRLGAWLPLYVNVICLMVITSPFLEKKDWFFFNGLTTTYAVLLRYFVRKDLERAYQQGIMDQGFSKYGKKP